MKYKIKFAPLFFMLVSFSFADDNKINWDGYNNPYRMDQNFNGIFSQLPLSGKMYDDRLSWPDSYWPNYKGSIAWRWSSQNPRNFRYRSPSLETARTMSSDEINELSPAEKFDLYVGNYDYPTVKKMWRSTSPSSPFWYGICHGVAPAGIHYPEPKVVNLMNKDGIEITFYSSDVKALISNYYARESDTSIVMIGKRCFWRGLGSACSDINAGSFHIILANKLGIQGQGFIADLDRNRQVWNHAPVSYESEIIERFSLNEVSSNFAVQRVELKTKVVFTASIEPQKDPVIGTELAEYDQREYRYYLDLNSQGEIVGGYWLSWARPDFVWHKEKEDFNENWSALNEIYQY